MQRIFTLWDILQSFAWRIVLIKIKAIEHIIPHVPLQKFMPMGSFLIWQTTGLVTDLVFSRHVLEIVNNKLSQNRITTRWASQCGLLNSNFSYNLEMKKRKICFQEETYKGKAFFSIDSQCELRQKHTYPIFKKA